ncbi:hypothetical protein CDAR_119471 [Caerostris darwini]|uniref:Uncharacterized protein n=1 Tax=Caerostris darwini TaxID=1538125 RepID=A0AAV4S5Y0_9ARAC|nr:hypothetical protein CDAR_119471 [Caerostris darwini]
MQQLCFLLEIKQALTPIYWPQISYVKMKNRDVRPKFTILVGNNHTIRSVKLLPFSFALNGANKKRKGKRKKFAASCEGPFIIVTQSSPTSYEEGILPLLTYL